MKAAARPGSAPADIRHKERLHAEIQAVREQKRKLERDIAEKEGRPAGWVPFPGPRPASLSVGPPPAAAPAPPEFRERVPPSSKRPGMSSMGGGGGGEVKKQRVGEQSADKAREDVWRNINKLLLKMWQRNEAIVFRAPVDPIADKVPDYLQVIRHPMDLGTIKANLLRHNYAKPADFAADVRLVFHNCRTYNPPGHVVTKSGDILSDLFEKQWLSIEQQWDAIREVPAPPPAAPTSVQQQMSSLMPQYCEAVRKTAAAPSTSSVPRPGSNAAAAAPERDMSFEEKRRLSIELGELSAERLSECLRIIAEQMPDLGAGDESEDGTQEVEVDIDALSAETLWRLRDYISYPHAHQPRAAQQHNHNHNNNNNNNNNNHHANGGGGVGGGGGKGGTGAVGGGGQAAGQARSVGATPGTSGRPAAAGSSQVKREREQPSSAPVYAAPVVAAAAVASVVVANGGGRHGSHVRQEPAGAGQQSRGPSLSDRGDGSDQDSQEPHEVKGSTADNHNPSSFVRPGATASAPVAESGIQSKNQTAFVGSQAARKADAPKVLCAAWGDMESTPTNENGGASGASTATVKDEEDDGLWSEFKTREQVQQQKVQQAEDMKKAEEERRAKDREDQMAGAKRQVQEEAERARQLEAEVARQAADVVATRQARKAQELQELQDRAGTAVHLQQPDDLLLDMDRSHAQALNELGLTVKHSAHVVDFDD